MDRDEALKLLRGGNDGVAEWNRRREQGEDIPDLSTVDFSGADLSGAQLSGLRLESARFGNANLSGANLSWSNLFRADLTGANVTMVNFSETLLDEATFSEADLRWTNFNIAYLDAANFSSAKCGLTVFANVDLSSATGLESVSHIAASAISVGTLYMSKGQIPEGFLRGCGVPDSLIANLPALLGSQEPVQFYSCFISYSHQDEEFSKRLHSRMREDKLRVWYAPEDMKSGRTIHEQIDSAIKLHDKLLVVLSEHSINSPWVKSELRKARQREVKDGKRVLFPIRLIPFEPIRDWELFDADTGIDTAAEIREYFIPDFTNWKDHDSFEESYQRLMKDFKPAPDDA